MPLPTNNSRPSLPYNPEQSLPNSQRFGLLGDSPPTAQMVDGELNCLTDYVNMLAEGINEVQVGAIPGANDPSNANKLLVTDGGGNLSWILVEDGNIDDQAVTTAALQDGAVTQGKLGAASVGAAQLQGLSVNSTHPQNSFLLGRHFSNQCIPTTAYQQNTIPGNCIKTGTITGANIASATITGANVAANSLGTSTIYTGSAPLNSVLTVTSNGQSTFAAAPAFPTAGTILQIQSYVCYSQNYCFPTSPTNYIEFITPFRVSITPKKSYSTILVFFSANLICYPTVSTLFPQNGYYALFKNGSIWNPATGNPVSNQIAGTGEFTTSSGTTISNVSNLCSEIITSTSPITYSLRVTGLNAGNNISVAMNTEVVSSGQSYTGVACISSIYAIEVGN